MQARDSRPGGRKTARPPGPPRRREPSVIYPPNPPHKGRNVLRIPSTVVPGLVPGTHWPSRSLVEGAHCLGPAPTGPGNECREDTADEGGSRKFPASYSAASGRNVLRIPSTVVPGLVPGTHWPSRSLVEGAHGLGPAPIGPGAECRDDTADEGGSRKFLASYSAASGRNAGSGGTLRRWRLAGAAAGWAVSRLAPRCCSRSR